MTGLAIRESGLIIPDDYVHGRGVIEVFDADTGRLVQREPFTNFITQATKDQMKYQARKVFFSGIAGSIDDRFHGGGDVSSNAYNEPGYWTPQSPPCNEVEPFYNMTHVAITTDTAAEDPAHETYMRKSIVAWSGKGTYIGTDTKQGSPNLTESYADGTKTRWVFDWPTNAGNGTFQSVCWVALNTNQNPPFQYMRRGPDQGYLPYYPGTDTPYLGTGRYGNAYNRAKFDSDDTNDRLVWQVWDAAPSGSHLKVWHAHWDRTNWVQLYDRTALNIAVRGTYYAGGTQGEAGPIACSPSYVYNAQSYFSVHPCLVVTDYTGAVVSSLANDWATLLGMSPGSAPYYMYDIAWDGSGLWLAYGYNGTSTKAVKINPTTGAILATIDISTVPGIAIGNVMTIAVDPDGNIWLGDGAYFYAVFDSSGTYLTSFSGYTNAYTPMCLAWRNSGGVSSLYGAGDGSPDYLSQMVTTALGARTRLGAAVTKANTQTMKLTYEFDYS